MTENSKPARSRFAPSPTGFLHIGGLRTALYNFAFAKSQGGKFILRIEDTDQKRVVENGTEEILKILKIFKLNWDEGPFIQSERSKEGIYKKYAEQLVKEGKAYHCFCTKQENEGEQGSQGEQEKKAEMRDKCRELTESEVEEKLKSGIKAAIRLRVPENETIAFVDFVLKKEISWETKNVDEVILLKSDGFPTYHLAMAVDDTLMEISHVLRGPEWLPSTPVHLLILKYLNFTPPKFGHLTAILDPEGGKLSKRKGSVSCEEFLAEGYLPEAILNFIMLLGWAPKDNRELFTLDEFVQNFQNGNLQTANPVFARAKLDWFNGVYLRQKTDEELLQLIRPFAPENADESLINKTIPLIKDRIVKLSDYQDLAKFFFEEPKVDKSLLNENAKDQLIKAKNVLEKIENWTKEEIEKNLKELIEKEGWKTGDFFMNFRIAITGSKFTPPITDSVEILGKEKTLKRIEKII